MHPFSEGGAAAAGGVGGRTAQHNVGPEARTRGSVLGLDVDGSLGCPVQGLPLPPLHLQRPLLPPPYDPKAPQALALALEGRPPRPELRTTVSCAGGKM